MAECLTRDAFGFRGSTIDTLDITTGFYRYGSPSRSPQILECAYESWCSPTTKRWWSKDGEAWVAGPFANNGENGSSPFENWNLTDPDPYCADGYYGPLCKLCEQETFNHETGEYEENRHFRDLVTKECRYVRAC